MPIQIRPVGSPDDLAEKLHKIFIRIPEEVIGPFDMMDVYFYVDCLRTMANAAQQGEDVGKCGVISGA